MNEKEERDLKVLAAPAGDQCAGFARSPAARGRRRAADRTDGRTDGREPGPRGAGDAARGLRRARGGQRLQRGPGALSTPGPRASPRAAPAPAPAPAPAGHAAGSGLRGGGACSQGPARPLCGAPGRAPGARRASWRRRGAGTSRLSLSPSERVYERSVPAVADDDAAPAGE